MLATIRVRLNGEEREVSVGTTLADLLGEPRPGYAAAVNGEVIPKREWPQRTLFEGDTIEFVRAIQGG